MSGLEEETNSISNFGAIARLRANTSNGNELRFFKPDYLHYLSSVLFFQKFNPNFRPNIHEISGVLQRSTRVV